MFYYFSQRLDGKVLMFLTLWNSNFLLILHVSLFIFFPPFAYLTCWYRPRGLWDFFFFPSYNGECRNHLYGNSLKKPFRIEGRQDNKQEQEKQRILSPPHLQIWLCSGHHLFSYIVSPLLASTRVLPTLIKNEMDRMLFLRPIYILLKNASAFQKKGADVCCQMGWIQTGPAWPRLKGTKSGYRSRVPLPIRSTVDAPL